MSHHGGGCPLNTEDGARMDRIHRTGHRDPTAAARARASSTNSRMTNRGISPACARQRSRVQPSPRASNIPHPPACAQRHNPREAAATDLLLRQPRARTSHAPRRGWRRTKPCSTVTTRTRARRRLSDPVSAGQRRLRFTKLLLLTGRRAAAHAPPTRRSQPMAGLLSLFLSLSVAGSRTFCL